MSLFNNRDQMWFGTIDPTTFARNMRWIPTPNTGADVSSLGFSAESTLLNGGGYARNSWDSHKNYQFSWGESASPELVSVMQAYRNGSYGRAPLYFNDPMQYQTNLLPKRVADPSMAVNYEAEPLVPGLYPRAVSTGATPTGLPAQSAVYDAFPIGQIVFAVIPVPPGHTVGFGWSGQSTETFGTYGISSVPMGITGWTGGNFPAPLPASSDTLISSTGVASSGGGALVLATSYAEGQSPITISGMTVRIAPPGEVLNTGGPWYSGEGHSGCQFVGNPTVVNYNGVDGGQLGLSVNLKETGAWA